MSDDNQIYLPESFTALYVPPGKIKPSIGHREMAERYLGHSPLLTAPPAIRDRLQIG